ncbi:hypothetical protein DYB32_001784 [Aphanomyces invadans]|uniref:Dynein heavy chain linker domain-containing protein n=1 Tax=Aphanomyces invadans TaxID=157072 RepID=A0A3R7ADI7_9STRA|nr:hypothetical protein DYB32_001784 [Aphanomyces invadans]
MGIEIRTVADAVFAPARKPLTIHYLQYDPSPPCQFTNVYWLRRVAVESLDLRQPYFTLTSHALTHVMGTDTGTARMAQVATSSIVDTSIPVAFDDTAEVSYELQLSDLHATMSNLEALIYTALAPLLACHGRYGAVAASTDVIPTFIRVVDLMVVEALFEAVTTSMDTLLHSMTGVMPSQGHIHVDAAAASCDVHSQVDSLLARPFERTGGQESTGQALMAYHVGSVAYKRLFQLHSAQRAPDPLFFVRIAIHDATTCTISPPKEAWLRKLHDALARYIGAIDSVGRVSARPRVRQFIVDHCRPYYRHCFANDIHPLSVIVNNHTHVATAMTRLRAAMDIYFAEIELQATQISTATLPLSVDAIAATADICRAMQMFIAYRRELTVVDSVLQVGCFLVDRSNFVGNMLHECKTTITEMYSALPRHVHRFMTAVLDGLARNATTMASIPESVDEVATCTKWLECYCSLQRKLSSNVLVEPQLNALKGLIDSSQEHCDVLSDDLRATLITSFESGRSDKALAENMSRIEANQPFYLDLFHRTYSSRRDALALEFASASAKMDQAMSALRIFDSFPADGFGGPDVQQLVYVVRHFVDQSAVLLKFESLVDAFRTSSAKVGLQQRRHSTRQMSIDHIYKDHDRLHAVLVLLGIVQAYVQLRTRAIGTPLADLDLPSLATKLASLKKQSQPYCAMLGGTVYPLVAQFYPSIQVMDDAVAIAVTMVHSQFTDARWGRLTACLDRPGATTCTLQDLETALRMPASTQLLTELNSAVLAETRIQDTMSTVKQVVAALTFEFESTASHDDLHVTNCLALIASLEDAHMTLLPVRHGQNPWLQDVERLETRILDAIALLSKIHTMESQWSTLSTAAAMPEVQAHADDASMWLAVGAMESTWRESLLAVYRWEDSGDRKANVMVKLETVFQAVDFPSFLGLCDRIRAIVDSYLASLRSSFGRLYFVSDADMLQLFRRSSIHAPTMAIQRCYPGVGTVHAATTPPATAEPTTSAGQIAGLMDADFMTWLLGDHAVSFLHTVEFQCTPDNRSPWTLPLHRPVKVLGPLSFWLGQFDMVLAHSLAVKVAHLHTTITTYDPTATAPSMASPVDCMLTWSATVPPQVALSLLHLQFCTVVENVVAASPKHISSSRALLASTAAAHRVYFAKLVASMRAANECHVAVEDAIVWMSYQDSLMRRLTKVANSRDWTDVVHEWHNCFRLAQAAPRSCDSKDMPTRQARMGHLVVPCGLEVQPKMPWMVILPETQRCMFALFHAMRLSVCAMPFGAPNTGKRTMVQGLGYLLMRCQWQLHCTSSTTRPQLTRFLAGISALHGWGCMDNAFELPVTLLCMVMAEMETLQHARALQVSSATLDGLMTCSIILPYQSTTLTQPQVTRWLGEPLRPDAICRVHNVLATLFASAPHKSSFFSMRLLQLIASTACAITKQVSYIIQSPKDGKGRHVRHDASPLNLARYKDANVFRFALLLVLEPLGIFARRQLYAVVDQFVPTTVELTIENPMVAAALHVVLERSHCAPIPSLVQKGVELHHVLQVRLAISFGTCVGLLIHSVHKAATPAVVVGSAETAKSTCVKAVLRSMQLLASLLHASSDKAAGNDARPAKIRLTVVPLDELIEPSTALAIVSDAFKAKDRVAANCVCFDGMMPSSGAVVDYITSLFASTTTQWLPHGEFILRERGNPMVVLEVVSLATLSPALLTNCTVLCMDQVVITWQHLLDRWVQQQPSKDHPTIALVPFLRDTISRCVMEFALPFQATMPKYPMTLLMANILHLVASIYDSLQPSVAEPFLEQCLFLAVMWGMGSYLSTSNRERLQSFVVQSVHEKRQASPWPSLSALFLLCLEHACTLFDMAIDLDENRIASASSLHDRRSSFSAMTALVASPHNSIVATSPMQFASGLYSMLRSRGVSMIVSGPRGSGKSTTLQHWASVAAASRDAPQDFLNSPSLSQHGMLKRWMLQTKAGREVAFVDDVGLDDPRVFQLCRNAIGIQRLFDASNGTWATVHATIYGSVGDSQLDQLSSHERLRFLRHFYVVKLTEPSRDDLVAIYAETTERSVGRRLHPEELWIVERTISTLQQVKRDLPPRLLPQYHFGDRLIQHIVDATLSPATQSDALTWTWLVNMKTFVWDALATDTHRQRVQSDIQAAVGTKDTMTGVDFESMVWHVPWVSAILKARHSTATSSSGMYTCVRDHIVAEHLRLQCVHGKVDLVWVRAMNSSLVGYWIKLMDALQTNKQVVVVGGDRQCHNNVVKLVGHLSHTKFLSCHELTAPDFFRGHATAASQAFVVKHTKFVPPTTGTGNGHVVQDMMRRMRSNLCCVIHFCPDTAMPTLPTEADRLDALLAHRSIPTTVLTVPSFTDTHPVETALGFVRHLADQHKELGLSEIECNNIAHTCVDLYTAVCDHCIASAQSCPSIFNLLHSFKHVLELRVSITFGTVDHIDNVAKAVDLLEDVRASFSSAQKRGLHWDAAYDGCRVRQAALKKVSFTIETKVATNAKLTIELEQRKLPLLQQQLDDVVAAVDHVERQLRIDRKALDHVEVGTMTAADKQHMLGEWRAFQPLVRMTTALCLAFRVPEVSMEAACDLMDDPAFASKLIHLDLPASVATGPFQQALAFALADVAVLHTKQPMFASVVRWLNHKSMAATAVQTLAGLRTQRTELVEEVALRRANLDQLRAEAVGLSTHVDTIRMRREELSMEATEAKTNYNAAKNEVSRLFPLQSFVEYYLTWLRSKYWVHSTSSLANLLYLASVVAYAGSIPSSSRPDWMATLVSTLARHGFALPLDTALIADSTASLVSILEGDVCFASRDNSMMRENLLLADWSCQTPLFVDPYGMAEAALVHFFTRMHVALPGTHHTVLSCLDPNLLDSLNHALLDNAIVVLHHFSMDKFDVVRPFLHHRRTPLTHLLLLKEANRTWHRHCSSVKSLALPTTHAPLRHLNGSFQMYLVAGEQVELTRQESSMLNVLDCTSVDILPALQEHLESLVGLRPCGNLQTSVTELTNLQTFVDMHALLVSLLAELQRVPTQEHLIHAILKYDQQRRAVDAKLVDGSPSSPRPPNAQSSEDGVSYLATAATSIAEMMHAVHHLGSVAKHCMPSVSRICKLMTAIAHEGSGAVETSVGRVAHIVEQLHVAVRSSLPQHCRRLLDCLIAVQRTPNAPPLNRVIDYLASTGWNARRQPATNRRLQRSRPSLQRAGHSQLHRLRRIQSTDTNLSDATNVFSNDGDDARPVNIPHRQSMARWNSVDMFAHLNALEALAPECDGISTHIRCNPSAWQSSVAQALHASPPHFVLPLTWSTPLSSLHVMLLMRCICPELLTVHMDLFIQDVLSLEWKPRTPRHPVLSTLVLVVVDSESDLATCPPLGGKARLSFRSRYMFDPTSPMCFTGALDTALAKGGTVVVELVRAEDFAEFYHIFCRASKVHIATKTLFGTHRVVIVCTSNVMRSLPLGFVQTTQVISLPFDTHTMVSHDQEQECRMHVDSTMARLSRGLRDVQLELAAWNVWHAVGWHQFVARPSHVSDLAVTLSHIGEMNLGAGSESARAAALAKRVVTAVQDGVLGSAMIHDHDRHFLLRQFVAKWVAASNSDHRRGSIDHPGDEIGGRDSCTDNALGVGVAPRMATFVRNVVAQTESAAVLRLCQGLRHVQVDTPHEHAVAVCRRIFREFLHMHFAHTGPSIGHADQDTDDNDVTASGTMLVTVAALKFRRAIMKLHAVTNESSVVHGLLLDDLAEWNDLWLHCLDRLDDSGALMEETKLLHLYHLPPHWVGLPEAAAPLPLASLATHMSRTSDFFGALKDRLPSVIPLGCLHRPDRFLTALILHNASALKCTVNQMHLELVHTTQPPRVASTDKSGVLFDDVDGTPIVRSVVVSGLWLFDGHDNRPLMDQLPPLELHLLASPPPLDAPSTGLCSVQLAWYRLWSLDHVGVWPFGDSRVFHCLAPKLWYTSAHRLPRPESAMILCPSLDGVPNAVELLQRPSTAKPVAPH